MTNAPTKAELEVMAENWANEARLKVITQCDALIDAGWKWEVPGPSQNEAWQWYWRRPPRRKGSKGMFFWSTQQAYNHLCRSRGKEPDIFV